MHTSFQHHDHHQTIYELHQRHKTSFITASPLQPLTLPYTHRISSLNHLPSSVAFSHLLLPSCAALSFPHKTDPLQHSLSFKLTSLSMKQGFPLLQQQIVLFNSTLIATNCMSLSFLIETYYSIVHINILKILTHSSIVENLSYSYALTILLSIAIIQVCLYNF